MRTPKPGDVIAIEFYDHQMGDGEENLASVTAHGKVITVDANKIIIDGWHATDPDSPRKSGDNTLETFVIVRKAVNEIRRVTRWETL